MSSNNTKLSGFVKSFMKWHLEQRPVVDISKCTGCAECKPACSSGAIEFFAFIPQVDLPPKTGEPRFRPEIEYRKCNRCYRCQELCPRNAIKTHKPRMMKILRR